MRGARLALAAAGEVTRETQYEQAMAWAHSPPPCALTVRVVAAGGRRWVFAGPAAPGVDDAALVAGMAAVEAGTA